MTPSFTPSPQQQLWIERWQRFSAAVVRYFHVYAGWLVGISWKRFVLLALALLIGVNVLKNLPPFTWHISETVEERDSGASARKARLEAQARKAAEQARKAAEKSGSRQEADKGSHYEIKVDERGVRILPVRPAASAASAADGEDGEAKADEAPAIAIDFPKSTRPEDIRAAIEQAKEQLGQLKRDAEATKAAQDAAAEAQAALQAATDEMASDTPSRRRVTVVQLGDTLVDLAILWILASAVIKAMYKGRIQAEVKAAQATETAEAESLKRQVVEARMAAMQAQVEPHFLFNTLASIDHLIETDPPRASQMQRNLIALLRASMPTMREANANGGLRDLGRELAVIRPYLEILKVRMEERLQTEIDVPEGLMSAEFPPMMIQGLVENAIKHGLEPKAEGGKLTVKAEIVHGKLAVTVADTGLGFGRAATSGTGVGLANIRERLQLLHGNRASVTVTENQPSGTVVTITVPYRSRNDEGAAA
ncbi:sensor histidine kinase [Roseateles saccharophilus]|uniref:histidine kinase n=1 Tax=Roseateles saccharophilus TaxID=304 RepID=A0A4R3V2J3_ROSSA|nr:histidine kinase [Roseateles saccharophilus]MDG0831937.1 sensor histidine kinase [Roseateles saccharophilus]TCU97397.1 histidine kinase/DNA gyrase B/HSP90-like ATPase [Roseateles saccharophilus]